MKKLYLQIITLVLLPIGISAQTNAITAKTAFSGTISASLANAAPTIAFNITASKYVNLASGVISCVIKTSRIQLLRADCK